jgi:hypothetical protein
VKFPITFKQKEGVCLIFYMSEDTQYTNIPDMTDVDEVRKAIIANEILNRKY